MLRISLVVNCWKGFLEYEPIVVQQLPLEADAVGARPR
jgi:hypothetical protein